VWHTRFRPRVLAQAERPQGVRSGPLATPPMILAQSPVTLALLLIILSG